ncbi:PRC-barrel domain-containing protein [Mesorhizobium sp.]|uniref:PRC-barrel domain-containing protein n=1 Tax=Mesorhizobium sp. TaxID=1871066 RepID=UPI0025DE12BA|nr:PRC-barrel domain-containing protein [Mesorhizobium sp.]
MYRLLLSAVILVASVLGAGAAQTEVAGSTTLGVATLELRNVATGWSTKRQILGKPVFNEKSEVIGNVDDVIVAPDKALSYAIIATGGFLGVGKHDVAIPVSQFKQVDGKFVLPGATKDIIKAMPPFEYAH